MLVLTRRIGEEIIIADGIRVSVVQIRGGRVQLGIEAPPEIRIQRKELLSQQATCDAALHGPQYQ